MAWLLLLLAVISEVIATAALKESKGFTKLWPSVIMIVCFSLGLYLVSLTLKTLPISVVYATYSGSGVALITVVGRYYFKQILDKPALIGIAMITAGVIILQLFSTSVVH